MVPYFFLGWLDSGHYNPSPLKSIELLLNKFRLIFIGKQKGMFSDSRFVELYYLPRD